MADISDVLTVTASAIGAAIYPNGTSQASATSYPTRIYPGWPLPQSLDADIKSGTVNVSIYPLAGEKIEPMLSLDAVDGVIPAATMTLAVSNNTVTVGGTPYGVAMVEFNYKTYAYAVKSGDTTSDVAAALATLTGGSSTGNVLTLMAPFELASYVSQSAQTIAPLRRQSRRLQITTWANTPAARDVTAAMVDNYLQSNFRQTLGDGTTANLAYIGSPYSENAEKSTIYRRDLIYTASWLQTIIGSGQQVGSVGLGVNGTGTPVTTFNRSFT